MVLKDGEPVPPLLAANITESTVSDIRLGSTIHLQVVAFAGPPQSPRSTASDDGKYRGLFCLRELSM